MVVDPKWVVALMMAAQSTHPYEATYERTASAIAKAAERYPAFAGPTGEAKTAALMVSLAQYESSFKIDAEGDCDKTDPKTGMCIPGSKPHSFGLFQLNESNFAGWKVTRAIITTEPDKAAEVAAQMIRQSFKICSSAPLNEKLRWYAGGGSGCSGSSGAKAKSAHRMILGVRLYDRTPVSRALGPVSRPFDASMGDEGTPSL